MNSSTPDATYVVLLFIKSGNTYATYHRQKSPADAWSIMVVTAPPQFDQRSAYETNLFHKQSPTFWRTSLFCH
jgi:hypothetical protein